MRFGGLQTPDFDTRRSEGYLKTMPRPLPPPRPEGVLDGLMALQRKIQRQKQALRATDPAVPAS